MPARRLLGSLLAGALVALVAVPVEATTGETLWTRTYDGPASRRDTPRGIAVDPALNRVYVVGTTTAETNTLGSFTDIVTIAYDADTGTKLWARRYDGAAHGSDLGVAIAYDPSFDGIVVTGASDTTVGSGQLDTVTIAYGPDGSRRWVRRATSPALLSDLPIDLVIIDGSTYVLIEGEVGRLIAYDAQGVRMWARDVTSSQTAADFADLDSIGDYLFVAGRLLDDAGGSAMLTSAFKTDGSPVWTKRFSGGSTQASASGAAVSGAALYVSGTYGEALTNIATIAYEPHHGTRLWRRSITPGANRLLGEPLLAASDNGSVALATSVRAGLVYHFLTRQYHSDGSIHWTARENEIDESGQPADVAIGPDGNVIVTGVGTNSGTTPGAFTLAYPSSGSPTLFQAPIPNTDPQDAAFALAPGPFGDQVFVTSRVGLDIRVDSYAMS